MFKIYTFWLGDEKRKKELIDYIKKVNRVIFPYKIELGPSDEEHKYLLKKSKFYQKAYEEEIYAFCSDYYRIYKIHQTGGLWIDSGCSYNLKKILSFLKKIEHYDYLLILEKVSYLWNGLFFVQEKNNYILKKILNHYDKLGEKIKNKKSFCHIEIGPKILSNFIFKNISYYIENRKNILLMNVSNLRNDTNKSIIQMHCTGSWQFKVNWNGGKIYNSKQQQESWEKLWNWWEKENYRLSWKIKFQRFLSCNFLINRLITYKLFRNIAKFIIYILAFWYNN